MFLNGVEAYAGIAAVDAYLGATQISETDPANKAYPGEFNYGGGHVIEELVAGRKVLWRPFLTGPTAIHVKIWKK